MARRATIQLKVHRQLVQSIALDDADVECLKSLGVQISPGLVPISSYPLTPFNSFQTLAP